MRAFYDMQRDVREGRERGNLTQQRHADVIIYPERMNHREFSFQALLDTRESYRFLRSAICVSNPRGSMVKHAVRDGDRVDGGFLLILL